MTVVDGKITKCTEDELYQYWLTRGYDTVYDFSTYKSKMIGLGVDIEQKQG